MPRPTQASARLRPLIAVAVLSLAAACSAGTKHAAVNTAPTPSSSAPELLAAGASSTPALGSVASSSAGSLAPSPSDASATQSVSPSASKASKSSRPVAKPAPTKPAPPAPPIPAPPPVAGQPLAGKVIVLDPGHNLNNSSSINQTVYAGNGVYKACDTTGTSTDSGYPEHAFTWDVANRTAAILRSEGATVIFTRSSDNGIGPCITTRAQIGNDAHADAFIAIHGDGGPPAGHGFFVMQPPPNNPNVNPGGAAQSRILATAMHDTFHATTGIPYSSYIANGYYPDDGHTGTINLSHGPVITIECLNMRNAGDAAIATDPNRRQSIAAGIAAGLTTFLTR